jgi:histidinol-phosphate aminotransferase
MPLPEPRADLGLREGYHSAQVDVEVRLNANESPFPPPAEWLEALHASLDATAFQRYPDRGAWELRLALAAFHGVRADQIFCANGSNEVLQSLCLAYGGAGRRVATFEPTYALHAHIAHLTGTGVVESERLSDFSLDLDSVEAVLGRMQPSLTFLCSPNNPTGMAESPATVARVLAAAPGLVVVDEAYGQFAEWSALSLIDDDRPLVVSRTYSKTWSMAAARLGYLIGPAAVVASLERVALPYHLDALKQAAGRLALRFVPAMEERVALLVAERGRLSAALGALPVTAWPSQANFLLFRPEGRKGAEVWQGLVDRSVLVRDCSSWPRLSNCLRVTVGTPTENDRFLAALSEVLA